MRKELEQIESIEKYLMDEVSPKEKAAFESEMKASQYLRKKVELQKSLMEGTKRMGLKQDASKAYQGWKTKMLLTKIGVALLIVGVVTSAIVFWPEGETQEDQNTPVEEVIEPNHQPVSASTLTQETDSVLSKFSEDKMLEDADAESTETQSWNNKSSKSRDISHNESKNSDNDIDNIILPEDDSLYTSHNDFLQLEWYTIDQSNDTVIETKDGLVMYIPKNAFKTDEKEVDVLLQTAFNPEEIIYSGLKTLTANGDTLETGGMFYVDAFTNGNRLELQKELTVDIPADPEKTGMKLYDGVKDESGEVVWTNPKPIQRPLIPVDILSLDFYPPGYEKWMIDKGYLNRDFQDSLYYSFADLANQNFTASWKDKGRWVETYKYGDSEGYISSSMTFINIEMENKKNTNYGTILNKKRFKKYSKLAKKKNKKRSIHKKGRQIENKKSPIEIKWNFEIERLSRDEVQIKFHVVQNNGSYIYSSEDWIDGGYYMPTMFLFRPTSGNLEKVGVIEEKYTDIHEETDFYRDYRAKFSNKKEVEFSQKIKLFEPQTEIKINYAYMECLKGRYCQPPQEDSILLKIDLTDTLRGINPASVKTIWNPKFNNTNLATKEFESRMPYIHQTCDNSILELYINNLDKNLYEIDKMAVEKGAGAKFEKFAALNQGKVNLSDEDQSALNKYYEQKSKAIQEAVRRTNEQYWTEQRKLDMEMENLSNESNKRNEFSKESTYAKELQKNTQEAYKDLGLKRMGNNRRISRSNIKRRLLNKSTNIPNKSRRSVVRTRIRSTGWKNIDCLMSVSTNRESANIKNGDKTTRITYNEWSATISDFDKYNKINAYNIPKEFNSYVKIDVVQGKCDYKLNDRLTYQTAIVAWNEDGMFFHLSDTKPGSQNISLEKIDKDEWASKVKSKLTSINNLNEEMDYAKHAQQDVERKNRNNFKRELRTQAKKVIFPCEDNIGNCEGGQIRMPNAFTPNGDGTNDFFFISEGSFSCPPENFKLSIYYGENIIYTSTNPNFKWDGTSSDGVTLPNGTQVVYYFEYNLPGNTKLHSQEGVVFIGG